MIDNATPRRELRLGDSTKILFEIEDKSCDVLWTDPPFNVNLVPQRKVHGPIKNDNLSTADFISMLHKVFFECCRILKDTAQSFVCCNWESYREIRTAMEDCGFVVRDCIVWDKVQFGLGWHFRPQHEFIIVASSREFPKPPDKAQSNLWSIPRLTKTIHPNEKPLDLIKRSLLIYNHPGDVVFDPFAGSGSTCVAAHELGMGYIGIEIDEHHYERAKLRLKAIQTGNQISLPTNLKDGKVERTEAKPLLAWISPPNIER